MCDGWCEQGGTTGTISSGTRTNYLLPYPNTSYTLAGHLLGSTSREQAPAMVKATNYFTIYHEAALNSGLGWSYCASGYINLATFQSLNS